MYQGMNTIKWFLPITIYRFGNTEAATGYVGIKKADNLVPNVFYYFKVDDQ